jgi:site-specific DNA-methyltransferase (adenine-specific)
MRPYYQDDAVTIYHGDCREVLPTLEPVDFIYADPPYGVGKADWDGAYLTGWEKLAIEKSAGGVVANVGTKSIAIAIGAFGDAYRDLFYGWNKNGMTRSSIGFMNVIVALVAGNVSKGQNFAQFSICDKTRKDHPSPKPIEYMQCVLRRFTSEGDIILDPFSGSGSTLVAAKNSGRKAIGIEIEEKYAEIAARRMAQEVLPLAARG